MQPISGSQFAQSSLIAPTEADGEWHRLCYSFLSPIDGYVYFYIEGSSLNIDLDEISLFRNTQGYDEDPNMLGKIKNTVADVTIPDITPLPDDSVIDDDFNIGDDDNIVIDNTTNGKGKKSDTRNQNNSNTVLIIIGSVAAAAIIAGLAVLIIVKKRRGKKSL